MANAKQCDRCGKYYSSYYYDIRNDNCTYKTLQAACVMHTDTCNRVQINGVYKGSELDLCEECAKSLIEWFIKGFVPREID